MSARARRAFVACVVCVGCGGAGAAPAIALPPPAIAPTSTIASPAIDAGAPCGGAPLRVRFYDVGQGLAALVELPDGRHVLVDAGDTPTRSKCDNVCAEAHRHLLDSLARDLVEKPIDLLWITHPHSDHMGGAPGVIDALTVRALADNGHDADKAEIKRLHGAAAKRGVAMHVVSAGATATPLADGHDVHLRAVTPPEWSSACKDDPNACSIALRIDYCASSILFTGDADKTEEPKLDPGAVTLLQVGHHGSNTSSSPAFLLRAAPKYAVISSGKPDEGLNRGYCHPRASAVDALSRALGGARSKTVKAYADAKCASPNQAGWIDAPASDRLWSTARDGDVVLVTTGNGVFVRE